MKSGRDAVVLEDLPVVAEHAGVGRGDRRAFARDLGGDALRDLAGGARVDEHVVLGLPEHVDEAGRDDEPGGVDAPLRLGALEAAHGRDAVADHADVGAEPGRAGAVHDAPAREEQVAGRRWGSLGAGGGEQGEESERGLGVSHGEARPPRRGGFYRKEGWRREPGRG